MTTPRAGRPRDEAARSAALDAARALVLEQGYDSLTMSGIAEAAGVARPTVYRWWRSKEALVADAVLANMLPLDPILARASGDVRADLLQWMRESAARLTEPDSASLYRALLAASLVDDDARQRMVDAFLTPLRTAVLSSLQTGSAENTESDIAADLLLGALLHALVTRDQAALERLDQTVDVVVGSRGPTA